MLNDPTVSIVLPVYNAGRYVGKAIESLLRQDCQDFEIILIDDGSTDNSLGVMEEYKERDRRIRILSRENKGLIFSLNEGVSVARGHWIVRMDSDDISLPDRISKQLDWVKEKKADVCGGWVKTFGTTIPRVRRYYQGQEAIRLQLLFNTCFAHPTILIRKKLLEVNPYDENAQFVEDYDLWARLAARNIPMTNFPGILLKYRIHGKQITQKNMAEQSLAREKVALRYREACFPKLANNSVHSIIMSRWEKVESREIESAVSFFKDLQNTSDDEEGVVKDNAILFLARHSGVGLRKMHRFCDDLSISGNKKKLLLFMSALGADQQSFLYKLSYRIK